MEKNKLIIRNALTSDAEAIAPLFCQAMGDIVYAFLGEKNDEKALALLTYFAQRPSNQYSFENCWVAEENGVIIAVINVYDGGRHTALRGPVIDYIRTHYQLQFSPQDETEGGEWYIDTLGVAPSCQGRGVGSHLIRALYQQYVVEQQRTLGLLVEVDNPNAKRLYLKLGFELVGTKMLMDKQMEHLQLRPRPKQ